jgi:hypothetical protein
MNPRTSTQRSSNLMRYAAALLLGAAIAPAALAQAPATQKAQPYTRIVRSDKTKMALQTRSVKFEPENGQGPAVWLVGVAHVGEAAYYEELQKLLDAQDLVLFERVNRAKPPTPPDAPGANKPTTTEKPVPTYQLLSDAIGLQYQMVSIKYDRPSFRNSDLTWEEMEQLAAKQSKEAQASLGGIAKLLDPNSAEGKSLVTVLNMVKSSPEMAAGLRVILAEGLDNQNGLQGTPIAAANDVVIKARNEKVIKDLEAEIALPTKAKSIAIFYGAGHLADFAERLTRMHYKATETKWSTAVNADEAKATGTGKIMIDAFRAQKAKKPPQK